MNTNKLPNLGSKGWGKSLNDYVEGIETRVSNIEHGLNEAREQERVFNISSGVVGFGGKMKQGENVLNSRSPLYSETPYFWEGDVFFKDTGDGFPLRVTMDENTNFSLEALGALETGWNPVYLFFDEDDGVTYRVDSVNAYLTHPLVILLGFIFYDGSEKYWYYKTSRSEENTYEKRFMLTKPLAKFNSTFSVGVSGDRYTIVGKQVGAADPTLTLNAMGINYENSSISFEELVRGPDYKEFAVKENTPIIWATPNSITFGNSEGFELSSDRSIHRVYFSNIGYYVIQSEKYNGNDDFSSVVSYGFQPMNTNLERYGDLVELFRFVTVGAEEVGDFINVYQAIGSGIPPVDSFGVVPEVNYVSKEGLSDIRFATSNYSDSGEQEYFVLKGQNYTNYPKTVFFNFQSDAADEDYNVLFNTTFLEGNSTSIEFKAIGENTLYRFSSTELLLEVRGNQIAAGEEGVMMWNPAGNFAVGAEGLKVEYENVGAIRIGTTLPANSLNSGIGIEDSKMLLKHPTNIQLTSPKVEITSPEVEITSLETKITSDNILIKTSSEPLETSAYISMKEEIRDCWPSKLEVGETYWCDPSKVNYVYYMTNSYDSYSVEDESVPDIDLRYAWYKDEIQGEPNWALGIGASYVTTGGQGTNPPRYYLVEVEKEGAAWYYRQCHILKEGQNVSIDRSFQVSKELLKSWTSLSEIGQQNNPLYAPNRIKLKSGLTTDILNNLYVEKGLTVGGDILVEGKHESLKVGNDSYKLVFLENVNFTMTSVDANYYWKNDSEEKYYLLENFPIFTYSPRIWFKNNAGDTVALTTWMGKFPLYVDWQGESSVIRWVIFFKNHPYLPFRMVKGDGEYMVGSNWDITKAELKFFTGWAWEVVPQGV